MRLALVAILAFAAPIHAGLYYSGETVADLPSKWRGFLLDHRDLRLAAVAKPVGQPASPLREEDLAARTKLEATAKQRPLSADELADLGALHVRLGEPQKTIDVLRPAARAHPDDFKLAANLGTAWQLAGDLSQAAAALDEAVRLAPQSGTRLEAYHRKLVAMRAKEPRGDPRSPDDLFDGEPPADAVAVVQQLALWLPADGRLLWLLAELTRDAGDVRTAANLLDGCVTEFGMGSPELRARRQKYRAAADALDAAGDHKRDRGAIAFKSTRALTRALDPATLPPIRPDGVNRLPWAAVGETEIGPRGKPAFLKYVDELDGKAVSAVGTMAPAGSPEAVITSFLLTEYPVGCWFCETPGPTQVLTVELKDGATAELTRNVVKVTGTLRLNRTDPERFPFAIVDATVGQAD